MFDRPVLMVIDTIATIVAVASIAGKKEMRQSIAAKTSDRYNLKQRPLAKFEARAICGILIAAIAKIAAIEFFLSQ